MSHPSVPLLCLLKSSPQPCQVEMIKPTGLVRGKLNCYEKETSQCDARFKRQACFSFSLQARADVLSWKVAVFHTGIQEPRLFLSWAAAVPSCAPPQRAVLRGEELVPKCKSMNCFLHREHLTMSSQPLSGVRNTWGRT